MADSLPPRKRGVGYATTSAISGAAGIVSPYIAGYLIARFEIDLAMRICYAIALSIGLVVATLRLKFLRETLKGNESSVYIRGAQRLKESYKSVWEALKGMPKNFKSILIISELTLFFTSITAPFWVVYVNKVVGLTPYQWGLMILVSGALRIAFSIPIGGLVDRYGKKRMIGLAFVFSLFPTIFFVYAKTFHQVLFALILISIANAITTPAFSALIADVVPKEKRGRIIAAFGQGVVSINIRSGGIGGLGFISSLVCMFGSLLSGYIYDANPKFPWFILSSALSLCLILTIKFVREPKKAES